MTPVDLEQPGEYKPKLVVNAIFAPESVWTVKLHRSAAIAKVVDWRDYQVVDAEVFISDGGSYLERLVHSGSGIYRSSAGRRPLANNEYFLNVTATSLLSVRAASSTPILSADWHGFDEVFQPSTSEPGQYKVQLTLNDYAGSHKYSISVDKLWLNCNSDNGPVLHSDGGATAYGGVSFESSFPALRSTIIQVDDASEWFVPGEPFSGTAWLSDELFQEESAKFLLTLHVEYDQDLAPHFRFTVTSYSHELWEYEMSTFRHDPLYGSFLPDRPVTVYTNVENGLGIFGGAAYRSLLVDANGRTWSEDDLRVGWPCDGGAD